MCVFLLIPSQLHSAITPLKVFPLSRPLAAALPRRTRLTGGGEIGSSLSCRSPAWSGRRAAAARTAGRSVGADLSFMESSSPSALSLNHLYPLLSLHAALPASSLLESWVRSARELCAFGDGWILRLLMSSWPNCQIFSCCVFSAPFCLFFFFFLRKSNYLVSHWKLTPTAGAVRDNVGGRCCPCGKGFKRCPPTPVWELRWTRKWLRVTWVVFFYPWEQRRFHACRGRRGQKTLKMNVAKQHDGTWLTVSCDRRAEHIPQVFPRANNSDK